MTDHSSRESAELSEHTRQKLRGLRRALLHLHKELLDGERAVYERAHGQVSSGQLLQLVINHEQFAWLRAVSELIVRIDEMLDAEEPAGEGGAAAVIENVRALLSPSETGGAFAQKYFDALQRDPAAVLAHREVTRALSSDG